MRSYWDSSALVLAYQDEAIRDRRESEGGLAKVHVYAEAFSTLTGGRLGFRVDVANAASLVE